jgi:hypothetical protein
VPSRETLHPYAQAARQGAGIYVDDLPARLLQWLAGFEPADIHKWIDRELGAS